MPRRARYTAGLAAGTKRAVIDRRALHVDIVTQVAAGLRHGVGIIGLDGYAAYTDLARLTVINQHKARLAELLRHRDDARRLARNARTLAAQQDDPQGAVARDYTADARRHTSSADRYQAEIDRLTELTNSSVVPARFTGEVDFLISGMRALLHDDGRVTAVERQGLRTVMPDLRLQADGDRIRWTTHLLVPADGRVFRLGPFTGSVPMRGRRLTPLEEWYLGLPQPDGQDRRARIHQLTVAGYPRDLARAASLAPGDFLVDALLGKSVTWPNCEPTFDHAKFTDHVRSVWEAHPGWAKGVYVQTSPKRQLLADFTAALGGRFALHQITPVLDDLGMRINDVYFMTKPKPGHNPDAPPWPATVVRVGDWSTSTLARHSIAASVLCPQCRQPATAVVRVLEVPDALLCRTCRIMPSRPDLVFPPRYLDLALRPQHIPQQVLDRARNAPIPATRKGPKPRPAAIPESH